MGAVMGYTEHTTANEVIAGVDLSGKVALVTGSSGGIGLETAREFAGVGATVVLANRDAAKSAAAADEIRSSVPGAQVETIALDLASLASVREFAATVGAAHPKIHLLVNNAGVMATPHGRTADDHELQFGTNHLGHFLLTNLLMPNLLAGAPARIVNLSSSAHDIAGIDFDDPDYRTRTYNAWVAYGQSKTANIL
ncbi:MAG: SDR family NAD(P)-dependent oxidoreductase, partial [Actinobacteria bacterium]|nr:SDR family NAD(P)-dependent oxidoreductase [Actinomycetota bacterium]